MYGTSCIESWAFLKGLGHQMSIFLKVHEHEIIFLIFLQKPKPYGPKSL